MKIQLRFTWAAASQLGHRPALPKVRLDQVRRSGKKGAPDGRTPRACWAGASSQVMNSIRRPMAFRSPCGSLGNRAGDAFVDHLDVGAVDLAGGVEVEGGAGGSVADQRHRP